MTLFPARCRLRALTLVMVVSLLAGCNTPPAPGSTTTPPDAANPTVTLMPTNTAPQPTSPPEPVIIAVNLGRPPGSLDPALVVPRDAAGNDLAENLFAGLMALDPDSGQVTPALVREWEILDDGLTWNAFLRDDIYWVRINAESGQMEQVRPITAGDVVYTVRRVCHPDTGAPLAQAAFVIKGCREVHQANASTLTPEFVEQTLGVRVLNDVAVEFRLESTPGVFLSALAMPVLRPVPADLVEAAGTGWTQPATIWTSGRYAVQPTVPAEEGYTLAVNEFYPEAPQGNVEVVQVGFADGAQQAYAAWQEGLLELSALPPDATATAPFDDDPRYRRLVQPVTTFIAFSYDTSPFDSAAVRRALSLALDREAIIGEILAPGGVTGVPARTLTPPGSASNPRYGKGGVQSDPDAARAALSGAGYPDCRGLPPVTLLTDESDLSLRLAEGYVQDWVEVLGCAQGDFTIEQQPNAAVLDNLRELPSGRRHERPGLITLSWQADIFDAHHWLADILGCRDLFPDAYLNQDRACGDIDNQLVAAATLQDVEARTELYAALDETLFGPDGEMPVIPVYFHARAVAIQPWVEAYPLHAGPLRFDRWVVDAAMKP